MNPLTIVDAMSDDELFGKDFTSRGWRRAVEGGGDTSGSWEAWKGFLATLYGSRCRHRASMWCGRARASRRTGRAGP